MIQVNRKISLEPFKSRLPGIIPAIMNNELYTFGDALIKRQNAYPSNYGMCPCSIVIPNNFNISYKIYNGLEEYTKIENGKEIKKYLWNYDGGSEMIVSYRRLVTWYHFFENYYHLLMDYGSCGKIYSSATQYYDCETQVNSMGKLYYEGNREFYEDLDKKFKNLGGSFKEETANNGCEEYLINLKDTGFYNWICTNCIPRFIIPKQFRDEWNATHIFYPDAIKWAGWFANRIDIYKDYKSIDECKNVSNCCDCEKFFKLGGIDMYNRLRDFVKKTRSIANDWKTPNKANTSNDTSDNTNSGLTYIKDASTIRTQVSLQINVDDMGEMSPMEEEWKGGIDYGNGKDAGGAVVRYNDDVYMLDATISSKGKADPKKVNGRLQYGYKFDEQFLEFKFGNEDAKRYKNNKFELDDNKHWIDYTDYYISKHTSDSTEEFNEFQPLKDAYNFGFNENGQKVILSGNTNEKNEAISISYNIERNGDLGYVLIEDTPYEIFEQEYIKYPTDGDNPYLRGRIFLVERYPITNTPYAVINKLTYISKDGKKIQFYGSNVQIDKGKFIYYKNILYKVDKKNNNVIIGYDDYQYEYPHIDGCITYDNSTYYVLKDKLYTSSIDINDDTNHITTTLNEVDNQEWGYIVSNDVVKIYPKKYTIYNAQYIEGKTESKLLDLQSSERTYDDLGNPLDGYYNFNNQNQKYAQPPEGKILEPLYQVGTVKNLTPIDSISNGDDKYFCGDILYNMSFYYVDDDGNKVDAEGTSCTIDWKDEIKNSESDRKTTLGAITSCKSKKEEIQSKYNDEYKEAVKLDDKGKSLIEAVKKYQSFQDDIRCDITYYMGATLEYVNDEVNGKGYRLSDGYNKGVEYNETVVFKVKPQKYYLKEDDFYMVNVIVPEREENTIYSNTYDLQYNDNIASIKMKIDILGTNDDEFKPERGFAHNNNTIIEPTIRQEYKFGISSLQSVDSDIYIDRGINAAFEKHLKLGEVSTMEDLTQYSNGFFKIMNS